MVCTALAGHSHVDISTFHKNHLFTLQSESYSVTTGDIKALGGAPYMDGVTGLFVTGFVIYYFNCA